MKDSEQQFEEKSLGNIPAGLFKAGLGVAFWSWVAGTGGGLLAATTVVGLGSLFVGRLIRGVGQLTGSKSTAEFGARVADLGVKVALSPFYMTAFGVDGLHSAVTRKDKQGLVNWLNEKTNRISGMNTVLLERQQPLEQQAPISSAPNTQQNNSRNQEQEQAPVTKKKSPIQEVIRDASYQQAQNIYEEKAKQGQPFEEVDGSRKVHKDGKTEITWADPNNPSNTIICTYDKDRNLISSEADKNSKVNCILPPKKEGDKYVLESYNGGVKQSGVKPNATPKAQNQSGRSKTQ
jgi:hypothetical protein